MLIGMLALESGMPVEMVMGLLFLHLQLLLLEWLFHYDETSQVGLSSVSSGAVRPVLAERKIPHPEK